MKLWSDSFADGTEVPTECAFGKPDRVSHVSLSDNRNPHLAWDDSLVHHYVFTLYALSIDHLAVTGRVTAEAVRAAKAGHIVAEATITGLYSLNADLVPRASTKDGLVAS